MDLEKYSIVLQDYLSEVIIDREPKQLYEPIQYILSLGGKRLRPVLTLMTCHFFKDDFKKAIPAAVALELFHNFSLIHDDIMDKAPIRRGNITVHEKWDLNTGILSGDAMLILAYQLFEGYSAETFQELAKLFSKTALEVCEGQQYDVDFESRNDVTISEYLTMIEYKTSVLIGAAMKMGAIIGEASDSCKEGCYNFGRDIGIAFQLQDDYLDAFGDPTSFGKQVGGDIIANKKTFLYIKALHNCTPSEATELEQFFNRTPENPSEKIKRVKQLFESTGAAEATKNEIEAYTQKANDVLETIAIAEEHKNTLRAFGEMLMKRKV
jgi:geranylgeranyl diphosphate synthase type II